MMRRVELSVAFTGREFFVERGSKEQERLVAILTEKATVHTGERKLWGTALNEPSQTSIQDLLDRISRYGSETGN